MAPAFLNVEKSFTNRRWVSRAYDERQALAIAQRHGLPDVLAKALSARCVNVETAESFLAPRLREAMPDPSLLKDMDKAVARFVQAIQSGEKISVFGDYDVDGATSSALLIRFARSLGAELRLYIPDRMTEGYGPNEAAMRLLAEEGARLVLCVDCGITAHGPLKVAQEAGLDVIVLDHHAAEPELPPAVAVVNPNRLDETLTERLGTLAAVGVTYLFVVAVNRALRASGFYGGRAEPDLREWLDLVALGTVCDVVKLTGLNRAYVAQGLKIMEARGNAGIKALAEVAGVAQTMDAFAAGFMLGPRVNAGGRVGQSDTGARLLATDDPEEASRLAEHLHQLNVERRRLEAEVLAEAENMIFDEAAPLAFVAADNWHPGVIGIVASRLKDKFHRPSIVIALENGTGKGSGRSIGHVDLGAAVIAARQAGLLINGGGHKMAAGLTVARDKIEALHAFLAERIGKQLEAEPFVPTLTVDGLAAVPALDRAFVEKLLALAPFGTGNPEPRFALVECKIIRADVVKEKHVRVILSQGGASLTGMAFRAMEGGLGPALLARAGQNVHVAGHLRRDTWNGRDRVQILIDDAALTA